VAGRRRRDLRVPGYAKAVLVDGHIPGYIRDLSASGCQVSFIQPISAAVGDLITVQVIAEHDPTIAPFLLRLRIRRIIEDPPWHSLGSQVEPMLDPREAEAFQRLVSYYSGVPT
jgi:hypothetical protein